MSDDCSWDWRGFSWVKWQCRGSGEGAPSIIYWKWTQLAKLFPNHVKTKKKEKRKKAKTIALGLRGHLGLCPRTLAESLFCVREHFKWSVNQRVTFTWYDTWDSFDLEVWYKLGWDWNPSHRELWSPICKSSKQASNILTEVPLPQHQSTVVILDQASIITFFLIMFVNSAISNTGSSSPAFADVFLGSI